VETYTHRRRWMGIDLANASVCLRMLIILAVLAACLPPQPCQAASYPFQFYYGAQIDLHGQYPETAIDLAGDLKLDWISIEFDWAQHASTAESAPSLDELSATLQHARDRELRVLIALSHPPAWALTENGPDPAATSRLAAAIAKLQPGLELAIELFPAANTVEGWHAAPDPTAYLNVFMQTSQALQATGLPVQVITSLSPLSTNSNAADIRDVDFLHSLYQIDTASILSTIGLRYPVLSGNPLDTPEQGAVPVLRHYETLRAVMLQHDRPGNQIWITGFSWPCPDQPSAPTSAQGQAEWLTQALELFKAQLFIGAAFFIQINPAESTLCTGNIPSLMIVNKENVSQVSLHPAYQALMNLTHATSIWSLESQPPLPPATGSENQGHLKNLPVHKVQKIR